MGDAACELACGGKAFGAEAGIVLDLECLVGGFELLVLSAEPLIAFGDAGAHVAELAGEVSDLVVALGQFSCAVVAGAEAKGGGSECLDGPKSAGHIEEGDGGDHQAECNGDDDIADRLLLLLAGQFEGPVGEAVYEGAEPVDAALEAGGKPLGIALFGIDGACVCLEFDGEVADTCLEPLLFDVEFFGSGDERGDERGGLGAGGLFGEEFHLAVERGEGMLEPEHGGVELLAVAERAPEGLGVVECKRAADGAGLASEFIELAADRDEVVVNQ